MQKTFRIRGKIETPVEKKGGVKIVKAETKNQGRGGGTERERNTEWGKRSVRKRKKGGKRTRGRKVSVPTGGSQQDGWQFHGRSLGPNRIEDVAEYFLPSRPTGYCFHLRTQTCLGLRFGTTGVSAPRLGQTS